jgi:Rod binding domain-containing protein
VNVADVKTPTPPRASREQLMQQARIWVNQTFFGVMLKQMHDSPFKSELFSGGRGGQVFASLLDQHLTQRIGSSGPGEALANSIVRRIERAHPHLFRETDQTVRTHVAPVAGD